MGHGDPWDHGVTSDGAFRAHEGRNWAGLVGPKTGEGDPVDQDPLARVP